MTLSWRSVRCHELVRRLDDMRPGRRTRCNGLEVPDMLEPGETGLGVAGLTERTLVVTSVPTPGLVLATDNDSLRNTQRREARRHRPIVAFGHLGRLAPQQALHNMVEAAELLQRC